MKAIRKFLAAAALAAAATQAHAGPYSDLWWNPQESGWGVNVVQQLETAFVTLFVYGPDGKPTWYVAPAAEVSAYGSGGPHFSGALYRTEGPWHGGPFDPAKVKPAAVGAITLEVLARDRMRVHYSVAGVSVVKEVTRQTWQHPMTAGSYVAQFVLRQAPPTGAPYGTRLYQADVMLHLLDGGEAFLRVDDQLGRRCEFRGPYQQAGKFTRVSGSYACDAGEPRAGTFELSDLEVTDHGVTGYLRTWSPTHREYGHFAAARY